MQLRKTLKLLYWLLSEDGIKETLDDLRIERRLMLEVIDKAKTDIQKNTDSINKQKKDRITDSKLIRKSIDDLNISVKDNIKSVKSNMITVRQFLSNDDRRLGTLEERLNRPTMSVFNSENKV